MFKITGIDSRNKKKVYWTGSNWSALASSAVIYKNKDHADKALSSIKSTGVIEISLVKA